MKKDKISAFFDRPMARIILVLFGIGLVFLIWWAISYATQSIYMPGPEIVIPLLFKMLGEQETYVNVGYTLLRMLVSFIASFIVAFIIGMIAGLCKPMQTVLKPLVLLIRTIPTAVLILSLVVFLRYQMALFVIVFLVMFPILYESVVSGITNIDNSIIQALRVDSGLYNPKALARVIIPSASPYILLGIVQTLGLGLKVSIMAEVMLGSTKVPGIGIAIYQAFDNIAQEVIFVYGLYSVIIIAIFDFFLSLIKKKIKSHIQ